MKILYLFGSINRGGAETLALDVFRNAKKYNMEYLCVFRIRNGELEQDFINSVNTKYIPVKPKSFIKFLYELRNHIKFNNVKIVHAHQPIDAFYALIACIGLNIPITLTLHSYDFETNGFAEIALKVALKYTNLNIYVSDTQKKYYINKYRLNSKKQSVIYNGISFDKFPVKDSVTSISTNLKSELGISNNKLLLVSVGNFTDVRDQLTICKFIAKLKNKFTDFHFVFVGSKVVRYPDFYDNCIKYCNQNGLDSYVTFLGNRVDVPQILSQSDAFIYFTNYDTFGIAVVEAMASGIPVFVNNWKVMDEITDEGKYATIFDSKDIQDLVDKFMQFLDNRLIFDEKAKLASNFVREKFSIDNHMRELQKTYGGLK